MKKIKLVVSDFHLGNGRYKSDGTVNPLEDFVYDDQFIDFLEFYGEEKEDQAVELIINGDFFNHIQLMPEEQELGILTERAAVAKTEAIVEGHRQLFEALKTFNSKPHRRLVFILGNHDPQLLWKGVKDVIKRVIQGEIVFVDDALKFDDVHIEHGHQLESIFRFKTDRLFLTKGYPEPILNLPWGVFFVKDYLYRLKRRRPYVDKVTPYGKYMRWCLYYDLFFGLLAGIRYLLFIFTSRFSKLPLKRQGAFSAFKAIGDLTRSPTLVEHVQDIIKREGCRIVILGHTHIPVHVQLDGGEYLNPGTWNDITVLDIPNMGQTKRLIYVMIEYRQGRPSARLLEWHGLQRPFSEIRA